MVRTGPGRKRPLTTPYTPSAPWFGPDGACSALEAEVMAHGGWVAPGNPRVREYLAREVLDGAMPVSYVARNHGIPLSRVKKWIEVFRTAGRAGLEHLTDKTHDR
jgi:hypothetical protein